MSSQLDTAGKKELSDLMAECYRNTKFMAQLLFPDMFYAPMSSLHDQFFDFIDNCKAKKKVITAPRGFGKSTFAKVLVAKRVLFRDRHFVGYLSNSSDNAELYTNNIRDILTANTNIRKIFGDMRTSKVEGVEEKWAQRSWIANGETMVLPRGAHQQVNGLIWYNYRPDFWIIDDLEDRFEIQNSIQRRKLKKWFYSTFLYTVSQYEAFQDYEFVYMDTVKWEDALITHLLKDKDWEHLRLPVCDENYNTLVPDFMTQDRLNQKIDEHRRSQTLDEFAREMMCMSSSRETRAFKQSYFKYYNENDPEFVKKIRPRLINVVIMDPAKTRNPKSAQTGLAVWGLDLEYSTMYLRFAAGEYLSPGEQTDKFLSLVKQYNAVVGAVEETGLKEYISHPIKNEMIRRRMFFHYIDLKPRRGKGELSDDEGAKWGRILSLLPYMERGLILLNPASCGTFEQQLLGSELVDVADAAGYITQVMNEGAKYMSPSQDLEPESDEDEYAALQNEPPMQRKVFV